MNLNHPRLKAEIRAWNRRLDPCACPRCGGLPEDPREVHCGAGELYLVGGDVYRYTGDGMASVLSVDWALERCLLEPNTAHFSQRTCGECGSVYSAPTRLPPLKDSKKHFLEPTFPLGYTEVLSGA